MEPTARHTLPSSTFDALARGAGGADAIVTLRSSEHSRALILLRTVVDLAAMRRHPGAADARGAYRTIVDAQRHDPARVDEVVRYPMISAWAAHTARCLDRAPDLACPAQLQLVAAAAALRARYPATIDVPAGRGEWRVLPSLGHLRVPGDDRQHHRLRIDARGAQVLGRSGGTHIPADPSRPAPGWHPFTVFESTHDGLSLRLVADDSDRHDLQGPRMTPAPASECPGLADRIHDGWRHLVSRHGAVAEEVAAAITVLAPLRRPNVGFSSGTFSDAVGCVAMSTPVNATLTALTFAHEVQHTKLAALMNLLPIVADGRTELFYAPWRADPRPLVGLLHGAYAHMAVADFWWREAAATRRPAELLRAQTTFARWREATHHALITLRNTDSLTPIGRRFVRGMAMELSGWASRQVSAHATAAARQRAQSHRRDWLSRHASIVRPS